MPDDAPALSRKDLLTSLVFAAASAALPVSAMAQADPAKADASEITLDDLRGLERIAGIELTDEERKAVLADVRNNRRGFEAIRKEPIDFTTEPPTVFRTLAGDSFSDAKVEAKPSRGRAGARGLQPDDLAFMSLRELGHLVRTRKVSPVALTELYLDRLKRYGDKLLAVVTLTEDLAMRQARRADEEIRAGRYRGPLHGIPYGVKDLFAVRGYPTTWGAEPYKDQVFGFDATVVRKLEAAGAVLVAKLSMGALALGDVWYRGTTKNPWNPAQGSSGSSAGSGSATAAGLVGFSIGTETLGSIASPSVRCRVSGLRPTYGRTSRYGGMALSYTMDKVGPMCREMEDCALVLAAICGRDPRDPSAVDRPFVWPPRKDPRRMKVGLPVNPDGKGPDGKGPDVAKDPVLSRLASLGVRLETVPITPPPRGLDIILEVESASAFDEFTRSGLDDRLKDSPWPGYFRTARHVPAVEYVQAQRARRLLMERFEREFGDFDALVLDGIGGRTLLTTNLTGHPQAIIPQGADEKGNSLAKSFVGRLFGEAELVALARLAQEGGDYHRQRPDLSKL